MMFDASIHQAKVETTNDPSLDKTVKESICEGYRKGEKILQPERVTVYQYKA
jgi:molecular chaperone GrpE (heat shock protein)